MEASMWSLQYSDTFLQPIGLKKGTNMGADINSRTGKNRGEEQVGRRVSIQQHDIVILYGCETWVTHTEGGT